MFTRTFFQCSRNTLWAKFAVRSLLLSPQMSMVFVTKIFANSIQLANNTNNDMVENCIGTLLSSSLCSVHTKAGTTNINIRNR